VRRDQDIIGYMYNDTEAKIREKIASEIEDLIDPPPIDEIDHIIVDVIKRCADIARGQNGTNND
jgi:hypothetical protein